MERLSSASTESGYVPASVPFRWEVAPGRSAVQQTVDPPSLPLPPGKRPKDGFYLPFPRPPPLDSPSSRERRPFRLRFPGSSNKPFSRKNRGMGGGVSPVSGHRFASRVARRVLVELQKRRSCLGACLSTQRKSSSSQVGHHHPGRRLDSILEPPSPNSAASRSADRPSEGHTSSGAGAGQQSQVHSQGLRTSRFMASMLMSLCPADDDEEPDHEPDEEEAVADGESFSADMDHNPVTVPRARVSSPEALFHAPREATPQAMASPSHEERTRVWVDLSTDMSRCNLSERAVHKEPTRCESCGTELPQPRVLSWKPRTRIRTGLDPDPAVPGKPHAPKSSDLSKDFRSHRSFASSVWQEALRSSPLWPTPDPITSTDDESDEDSDTCSTLSSERMPTPVVPPPRTATLEVSGQLPKSSSMLKHRQELQQDQSPRRSSSNQESTGMSPGTESAGGVMSKVAHFEAKAGVGSSSGKSLPAHLTRRGSGIIAKGKAVVR